MMTLAARAPECIVAEVPGTETEHAVPTPLAHMNQLVAQQVGRCLAVTDDHQRPNRDAVEASRNRPALPKAVSLSLLDDHDRQAYRSIQAPRTMPYGPTNPFTIAPVTSPPERTPGRHATRAIVHG